MLSFEEIENCFPAEGCDGTGNGEVIVTAQWIHDFAHAVEDKATKQLNVELTSIKDKQLELDAARYRYLRDNETAYESTLGQVKYTFILRVHPTLDSAIDKAMLND